MPNLLLAGGIVVTCAGPNEVLWPGDVLVRDGRIAAIGRDLDVPDAERIDVSGRIVMPGLVDTHRHTWQSVVRNIASDWTLDQYLVGLHAGLSRYFRPEDTYAGNLLGALEALDSGVTTLLDWSHNLFTPEHTDAAIDALEEAGLRAVFSHGGGAPQWGGVMPSPVPHPADDVRRLRSGRFAANDGRVTLGLALRGPQFSTMDVTVADFALARELDLRVSVHVGDGHWGKTRPVHRMNAAGLLAPTTTYVHCNTLAEDELKLIADTGGSASVATDVEMQMGHGWPATGRLLAVGVQPSLSVDVCSSIGGDMFTTMRTTLAVQRATDNHAAVEAGEAPERVKLACSDVLRFATIEGARANGLGDVTGSLEVGKAADIVVLAGDTLATTPVNNPFGTIVYAAHPGLVRDVLVDGRFVKRDGRLVGVDLDRLRALAEASRDHVIGSMAGAEIGGRWQPEPKLNLA
ncbi:amidohydrolase family protein [Micromonospora carbonacea]|uniref:Amidohydrolase family protein n=1 Tax=Micromonospora carbonacea TaxID=47853 RepID=A0A1C4VJX5_9ACTN|nr:amidohydrolase family protein [Micromonospora carbonacea]MBB5826045.1 cytosine/adenosine deaminase-related metal-dependent hydrolase [Micromonospora carbonacea]QLD25626.1 amidohydrolase family protein [Micromonospora carbonacea]SCE84302.1 Cytosine/adenosine deaminase [Micromonospora carbonacea]